jgi:hypothetical protein
MNKFLIVGLAVLCSLGSARQSEAAPVETDRYRVEFTGIPGKRLKASISWQTSNDLKAGYKTEDISRQVPIAFELDLPLGSSIIAAGSVPGTDPLSIKIFLNGFQCDDSKGRSPSNNVVRSCSP